MIKRYRRGLSLLVNLCLILTIFSITAPLTGTQMASASTLNVGGTAPGNYSTIQAAINAAKAGDTIFVYPGTYQEHITVNKTLTLTGSGMANTIISGTGTNDVVTVTVNGVKISDFTIANSGMFSIYAGVKLSSVQNCHIYNIKSSNNTWGIVLTSSSNNKISNNNCSRGNYGISLSNSPSNTIENNTCNYNFWEGNTNVIP